LEISEKSAIEADDLDPWSLYIYAMKAPMTRDRYMTRLAKFFDFIDLELSTKEINYRARIFAHKGRENSNWVLNNILRFVQHQKERANRNNNDNVN
jgi:predicted ATPase with chaperone activity